MPKLVNSTYSVEQPLRHIQPHKVSGSDVIPARLLKECASNIAPILADIITRSLKTGDVPADWRDVNISPIFKKGKPNDPTNYHPRSLTSIASKLLELIIHKSIMDHLDCHSILSNLQHSDRKERSCETQLAQSSRTWPLQLGQAVYVYRRHHPSLQQGLRNGSS